MEFDQKRVLVFGTGKSGVAAAELLQKKGAVLTVYDGNAKANPADIRGKSEAFRGAELILGKLPERKKGELDLVVLSPGVPTDLPEVKSLREAGIPIIGEIELAYLCGKGRLCAITGTNGKTTTTALTGEILSAHYPDVRVVGNIGIPYTGEAATETEDTVTVAEISSFQLETAESFHPEVTAILNITPDHLDRHHTMEAYIAAKESITKNQNDMDTVILNYEDPVLREFGRTLRTRVIWFSSGRELTEGFFFRDGVIFRAENGRARRLLKVSELNILGVHNYENTMAAMAMGEAMGVPEEKILSAAKAFHAVEHRIEFVAEKKGVRYYNDSKGTNPDAAIKAIKAMDRRTVLIGGGYDKGSTYEEWIDAFEGKVKRLILIGATAKKIAETCEEKDFRAITFASSLKEAVELAEKEAEEGDAVLLSPACASWDMFPNYEERGRQFKELVNQIEE